MIKNLLFYLLLLVTFGCSFNTGSDFWTRKTNIQTEEGNVKISKLFKDNEIENKEFNPNIKLELNSEFKKNSFLNNLDNNNGLINFDEPLLQSSRFKFSKIENFNLLEPDLIFTNYGFIFFNKQGTILNFDKNSKLIWKKNVYSKKEKKLNPVLFFSNDKNYLIVADNIAKLYVLNLKTGELIWKKNNSAPFNSQIKVFKDRFYLVDYENVLRCFSVLNGKELWQVKTEESFIKSKKKLSLIIKNNKVIFNNSIGDITAVDLHSGNLIWQTPTQSTAVYSEAFKLQTSDLVSNESSVYFSNNKNQFFSLDLNSGLINWKQKVNSNLRPTIVDRFVFTVSIEGFLFIIEKNTGKILRISDLLNKYDSKKRNKIKPLGFVMGKSKIYLTMSNGRLLLIDTISGKTLAILKLDNQKISRPFLFNKKLFVVKNNSIIKLN